jgi:hypothetical protein
MIDACAHLPDKSNVIAVEEVPRMERVHMYGVVGVGKAKGDAFEIPMRWSRRSDAPSNPSSPPHPAAGVFALADQTAAWAAEIQLTDAMIRMAWKQQPFYGPVPRAAASFAAARSASSRRTSPMRWRLRGHAPAFRPSLRRRWGNERQRLDRSTRAQLTWRHTSDRPAPRWRAVPPFDKVIGQRIQSGGERANGDQC